MPTGGGSSNRFYPAVKIGSAAIVNTRLVDAYMRSVDHAGSTRPDRDITICDSCSCPEVDFGATAFRTVATTGVLASTNASRVAGGGSASWAWSAGTATAPGAISTATINQIGAAAWAQPAIGAGWIGPTGATISSTPNALGSVSLTNWYRTPTSAPAPGTGAVVVNYTVVAEGKLEAIYWAPLTTPGFLFLIASGAALATNNPPVSGWAALPPEANYQTGFLYFYVTNTGVGSSVPTGFGVDIDLWSYNTAAILAGNLAATPTRVEAGEYVGVRVLPGTEVAVDLNSSTPDSYVGCGTATVTAMLQVVGTTAGGVNFGYGLLRAALTGDTCSCLSCSGVELTLYVGCDQASARTLRHCIVTGIEEQGDIDLPACLSRTLKVTFTTDDPRLFLPMTTSGTVAASAMANTTITGLTAATSTPGLHFSTTYSYNQERPAWPIDVRSNGTWCPIGGWDPAVELQAPMGSGKGYPYVAKYTRSDGAGIFPVRLTYDDRFATLVWQGVGWNTAVVTPPCDRQYVVTQVAYNDPVGSATFAVKSVAGVASPSLFPVWFSAGTATGAGGSPPGSFGPATETTPTFNSTTLWSRTNLFAYANTASFHMMIPGCPECPPPATKNIDLTLSGRTWLPNGWTYEGGYWPPTNSVLNPRHTSGAAFTITPTVETVTVVGDESHFSASAACPPYPPPEQPSAPFGCTFVAGSAAIGYSLAVPVALTGRCAVPTLTLRNSGAAIGNARLAIWDTTGLGAPTMTTLWGTNPVSITDFVSLEGAFVFDGRDQLVYMQNGVINPAYLDESMAFGPDGPWDFPVLVGGRTYTAYLIFPSAPASIASVSLNIDLWRWEMP